MSHGVGMLVNAFGHIQETVRAAATAEPDKFFVAKSIGTLGAEEAAQSFLETVRGSLHKGLHYQ